MASSAGRVRRDRTLAFTTPMKLGLATAAAVAVVALGFIFVPGFGPGSTPTGVASPIDSVEPSASVPPRETPKPAPAPTLAPSTTPGSPRMASLGIRSRLSCSPTRRRPGGSCPTA